MKKILTIVFTILISTTCMAQGFSYVYKGVEFKGKINNGVACIKSFNSRASDVTIPAIITHKGVNYPVKSVSVFMNGVNYMAANLTLEEGIEDIDKFCFNEFRKLHTVNLPASIRHIGKNAFRDNKNMAMYMLSSINETDVRKGHEIHSDGSGVMKTPQPTNYMASTQTNETQELQKRIKEQDKLLKEQQKLIAAADKRNVDKPQSDYTANTNTAKRSQQVLVDVDMDIPVVQTNKNANTYCVIIANEKYADVPEVEFAERDGNTFKEYCVKTLGIPEKQVKLFVNASYTDIKRALNWIETMSDISEGDSKILFYYAGHGIPNEKDKTAYLIPTDGFPKDVSTCFKLSDLYKRLGNMKSESVTVLLDACFSGVKRGTGQALIAARGVAIRPKDEVLPGNMVVFTAASDDETALAYYEKQHGMFTYFLLDQLKKSQGNASFGEIFRILSSEVKKNSMLENDKLQSPSVNVSANMKLKWEKMQF